MCYYAIYHLIISSEYKNKVNVWDLVKIMRVAIGIMENWFLYV